LAAFCHAGDRLGGVRRAIAACGVLLLASACTPLSVPVGPAEPPPWPALERGDVFEGVSRETEVLGHPQKVIAGAEDTFTDIGRRFNIGYEEMRAANPGIDPWIPGGGTELLIPTAHVIPDAPREGVVINLPAMRLWWFGPADAEGRQTVITHPIGIGKPGWATPLGSFHVISRATDPPWVPPLSVRRQHEKDGHPLPAVVPPGPDNPLGRHAVRLNRPSYLIHGTNKPAGIGLRATHGCIRLFPEDIERLYEQLPPGTKVTMVDQPWLAGWHEGQLMFESHRALEDGHDDWNTGLELLSERAGAHPLDWNRVAAVLDASLGVPLPVTAGSELPEQWLARAPRVENRARGNFLEAEGALAATALDAASVAGD
jgi:L,D-transpeptidase ErfK/SrfK